MTYSNAFKKISHANLLYIKLFTFGIICLSATMASAQSRSPASFMQRMGLGYGPGYHANMERGAVWNSNYGSRNYSNNSFHPSQNQYYATQYNPGKLIHIEAQAFGTHNSPNQNELNHFLLKKPVRSVPVLPPVPAKREMKARKVSVPPASGLPAELHLLPDTGARNLPYVPNSSIVLTPFNVNPKQGGIVLLPPIHKYAVDNRP